MQDLSFASTANSSLIIKENECLDQAENTALERIRKNYLTCEATFEVLATLRIWGEQTRLANASGNTRQYVNGCSLAFPSLLEYFYNKEFKLNEANLRFETDLNELVLPSTHPQIKNLNDKINELENTSKTKGIEVNPLELSQENHESNQMEKPDKEEFSLLNEENKKLSDDREKLLSIVVFQKDLNDKIEELEKTCKKKDRIIHLLKLNQKKKGKVQGMRNKIYRLQSRCVKLKAEKEVALDKFDNMLRFLNSLNNKLIGSDSKAPS